MILKIDTDLALPIAVAILAITITIGHQTLVPKSQIEDLILQEEQSFREASALAREVDTLTKELQSYHISISDIEHAGASHTQAIQVLKAAELYHLDPKP